MDKKSQRLFKSFACALAGLGTAYLRERNFRRHLACAALVIYGGFLFEFEKTQWIAVIPVVGLVLLGELVNTAIEHMTDFFCTECSDIARAVKDIAAGGVLICAIAAAAVGIILFWQPERFPDVTDKVVSAPLIPALVLCGLVLIVLVPDWVGVGATVPDRPRD